MSLDFRQVLQELVTEGSGEVLTCLASKLRGEQVEEVRHLVGEEGEEYRLEPTGMLVIPKLKHSESAPNILFHQEADTETGSKNKGAPKGILRSPGTPRLTKTRSFFRMTSHPTEVGCQLISCHLFFLAYKNLRFGRLRIAWQREMRNNGGSWRMRAAWAGDIRGT